MKIIIFIFIFVCCTPNAVMVNGMNVSEIVTEQINEIGIGNTIDEYGSQNSDIINELANPEELITSIVNGEGFINSKNVFKNILNSMFKEVRTNISLIIKVIIIAIFCGILKGLQDNYSGESAEIGFYICFVLMASILIVGFKDILAMGKETVNNIVGFMQVIIPSFLTIVASSGNVTVSSSLYPTLLLFIQVISSVFNFVLLPMVSFFGVFCIISNISSKREFSKIAGFIKSVGIWILGVTATLFVTIITAETSITSALDDVAVKTTKFAFSSSIPIVGKALSDAVETVMSCSVVIKNTTGWLSIIIIIGIILLPIIKILTMMLMYKFASGIIEPISDVRIANCLNDFSNTLTWLFAILVSISMIFIVAITILIKIQS